MILGLHNSRCYNLQFGATNASKLLFLCPTSFNNIFEWRGFHSPNEHSERESCLLLRLILHPQRLKYSQWTSQSQHYLQDPDYKLSYVSCKAYNPESRCRHDQNYKEEQQWRDSRYTDRIMDPRRWLTLHHKVLSPVNHWTPSIWLSPR